LAKAHDGQIVPGQGLFAQVIPGYAPDKLG